MKRKKLEKLVLVAFNNMLTEEQMKNITPETSLRDDLQIDSLDAIEALMNLEGTFQIVIDDDDLGNLKTMKDIYDLVELRYSENLTVEEKQDDECGI